MKRSLTILEIAIAMVLMGILLTGLFSIFHQGFKKSIALKEIKYKLLEQELFRLRLKQLFHSQEKLWLQDHSDARGLGLCASLERTFDADFGNAGSLLTMLYLNEKKQVCLATWTQKGQTRVEVLLDQVDTFECKLFDSKKKEWTDAWSFKMEDKPIMVTITLIRNHKEIPFYFFLSDSEEEIIYSGVS